jgi:HlyD family secretion protein/adhesin transport system membrane fusion protein
MMVARIVGWLLIAAAIGLEGAEAIVAFNGGYFVGLPLGSYWMLLDPAGPEVVGVGTDAKLHTTIWEPARAILLHWPAWLVLGLPGLVLVVLCRLRQPTLKRRREDRKQLQLLAQSALLEEAGAPRLVRVAVSVVAITVFGLLGWSAVAHVSEVAVTEGEVVPSGSVRTVQHLDGGVVGEILVTEGQLVDAGQLMIRLDPARATAELEQIRARRVALELQAERLRAFADNRSADFSFASPRHHELVADNEAILAAQERMRRQQRRVIEIQIEERRAELNLHEVQVEPLKRQVTLLEQEEAVHRKMHSQGLEAKVLYLSVQRDLARIQGDFAALMARMRQSHQAIAEAESRLAELDSRLGNDAMTQLGAATGELAEVREAIAKLADKVRRTEIRAPVRGLVQNLIFVTVGGVIAPGGAVAEVVPVDEELIVETRIDPRDIGHLQPGQQATVKVSTFDFARYGGITGVLVALSATTFVDDQDETFYKGRIKLGRNHVGSDPSRNLVLPGMTVQADINTGDKTILQYLLKPVYRAFNSGFHER